MTLWIRSLLFNILFYLWAVVCLIIFSPCFFLPSKYMLRPIRLWLRGGLWLSRHILNLDFVVTGLDTLPQGPLILASKHQSAWETFIFHQLFKDPAIVLKRELMWIPFFGWYLGKVGAIPLSRTKKRGIQSLKKLLSQAEAAAAKGRPILIFPEGTRTPAGQEGTYHSGVASLYLHLGIPVVPIALNSGLYWPRRSFLKYPGTITVAFLKPIPPGLSRQDFMKALKDAIEPTTRHLETKG